MTENLYKTIVVGIDGTEYSKNVISTAVELAKLTDAKLHAVYVSDVSNIVPTSVEWQLVAENLKIEAEAAFASIREKTEELGVACETVNLSGSAAQELVQYANQVNADLIIVGAAGKKALERLLLGSVSEKVIRSAKQNVLVIRSKP